MEGRRPGGTCSEVVASTSRRGIPALAIPTGARKSARCCVVLRFVPGPTHELVQRRWSRKGCKTDRADGSRFGNRRTGGAVATGAEEHWPRPHLADPERTPRVRRQERSRTVPPNQRPAKNINRQYISDGYRLLPMLLNSLEILLLSPRIAAIAARAIRAAINAYSIRSWPDSSWSKLFRSREGQFIQFPQVSEQVRCRWFPDTDAVLCNR
jgi:hypothetical protein